MKRTFLIVFLLTGILKGYSQTDSLLTSLLSADTSSKQILLPNRILFTQKMLWGEKGLLHAGNPLTQQLRERDLKIRRTMLVTHQVLGITTMAGLIGQAIIGPRLYKNPNDHQLKDLHGGVAALTNTTYILTASMSLFAPPPLVSRDRGLSSIRLHKWLAIVHMTGMLATNILASQMEDGKNPQLRSYHRAAAYATFASYATAFVVIKLK